MERSLSGRDLNGVLSIQYFTADTSIFKTFLSIPNFSEGTFNFVTIRYIWGQAVAQLVEALRYKSEDRGFDSRWCH